MAAVPMNTALCRFNVFQKTSIYPSDENHSAST